MKALVVYESMFGNTESIAAAIARGLKTTLDVDLVSIADIDRYSTKDTELLVVGGPTHAFSMTRESTRADALSQGIPVKTHATPERGIREWLDTLPPLSRPVPAAFFDTKVDKMRHLPGSAAKGAARAAAGLGFAPISPPKSFFVHGVSGPLLDGEEKRAEDWGRLLGAEVVRRDVSRAGDSPLRDRGRRS